jgi:hypothetical protein
MGTVAAMIVGGLYVEKFVKQLEDNGKNLLTLNPEVAGRSLEQPMEL